jgi:hypothetical protein
LRTQGSSFRCVSGWENLKIWREVAGWLVLTPGGLTKMRAPKRYQRAIRFGDAAAGMEVTRFVISSLELTL